MENLRNLNIKSANSLKLDHGEAQQKKAQALSDSLGLDLDKKNALPDLNSGNASQFLGHFSSNTCLNGAPGQTRCGTVLNRQ